MIESGWQATKGLGQNVMIGYPDPKSFSRAEMDSREDKCIMMPSPYIELLYRMYNIMERAERTAWSVVC